MSLSSKYVLCPALSSTIWINLSLAERRGLVQRWPVRRYLTGPALWGGCVILIMQDYLITNAHRHLGFGFFVLWASKSCCAKGATLFCSFTYSFSFSLWLPQKPTLLTPPPVITLKKKKSLGSPMNPFSIKPQMPKVSFDCYPLIITWPMIGFICRSPHWPGYTFQNC